MRLLIFLAVWKRPEITEICFMGIDRLRKNSRFPIEAFAVISEEEMIPLCLKYKISYTYYKNDPLGEKKNAGLTEAMKLQWDYLIEIGSDDLLKDELIELYADYFGKYEMFGTKDSIIINSADGKCRRLQSDTPYGLGRCISRQTIEKHCYGVDCLVLEGIMCKGRTTAKGQTGFFLVPQAKELEGLGRVKITGEPRYKLWRDDINKGLDNSSNYFMLQMGVGSKGVPTEKPLCLDIKGKENIWPFSESIGTVYDLNKALEGLSQEEQSAIFALWKRKKQNTIEYADTV
jgi:hypothetical protein